MEMKVALTLLITLLAVNYAQAAVFVLNDLNSSATIDSGTQAGQSAWVVDGKNYLGKQWFWYRVGPNGPEASIDTLPLAQSKLSDSNLNPGDDSLSLRYTGAGFDLDIVFLLTGGEANSQTSDLAESIKITNTSGAPLEFHFYQYVDLNLSPTDTVFFPNVNAVRQNDTGGIEVFETVVTPAGNHKEAKLVPQTLNLLNDALPTTLDDSLGPVVGDVAWAWEWDMTIAPRSALLISKDKHISLENPPIPEPATISLLLLGCLAMLRRR